MFLFLSKGDNFIYPHKIFDTHNFSFFERLLQKKFVHANIPASYYRNCYVAVHIFNPDLRSIKNLKIHFIFGGLV